MLEQTILFRPKKYQKSFAVAVSRNIMSTQRQKDVLRALIKDAMPDLVRLSIRKHGVRGHIAQGCVRGTAPKMKRRKLWKGDKE